MTTYEEWRVTGTLRKTGKPHASQYETEAEARALIEAARCCGTFTDGPHLHRRTVTVTDWEAIKP